VLRFITFLLEKENFVLKHAPIQAASITNGLVAADTFKAIMQSMLQGIRQHVRIMFWSIGW
jgi:hypothetical protein